MAKLYGITIDVPIYKEQVVVLWGDKEKAIDFIKYCVGDKYNNSSSIEDESCLAFNYISNWDDYRVPEFIYLGKSRNKHGTVAHEVLHFAMFLLASRNVGIDESHVKGHEALTYLVDYLIERIHECKYGEYSPEKKKWK